MPSPLPLNIPCPLQQAADAAPQARALDAPDRSLSYQEYHQEVHQLHEALIDLDLVMGHPLAIVADPTPETAKLILACLRAGILAFPLNPRFPVATIREHTQAQSCSALIYPPDIPMETLQTDLPTYSREGLITHHATQPALPVEVPNREPATLILTSGSSALPKAAALSLANHLVNATRSNQNIPLQPGDRWLMSLPLYHVAGLGILFRCLLARATITFPAPEESLRESILRTRPTHLSLVATQLYRLMDDPNTLAALQDCNAILLGGGPAHETLIRKASEANLPIATTYGLTEAATQVCTTRPGDTLQHLSSSGTPLFPDDFRIGEDDAIQIRGVSLFLGYRSQAGITRPATADGWFATRDRGMLDEDGYLQVLGRLDNMFISGGENIQPEQIEAVLEQLPAIRRAVVVPLPDPEFGAIPAAYIKWNGSPMELDALKAALRDILPAYAIPKRLVPWPEGLDPDEGKLLRACIQHAATNLPAS